LRNKGFKAIAVEPDFECEWSPEQLQDYENLLLQLGHFYVLKQQTDDPMRLKFIDTVMQGLNNPEMPGGTMCGVAANCAGIDHRGMLYACQRYASYNDPDKYALGDVVNGWDEYKRMKAQQLFRQNVSGDVSKGYNCNTCWVRKFCFKGCNAANRKWMGRRDMSLPMYCELNRIEVKAALVTLADLGWLRFDRQSGNAANRGCSVNR